MLNKEILIKILCEYVEEEYADYGNIIEIDDIDELHDYLILQHINGIAIEDYDAMYWEMCAIIEAEGEDIIDEVNDYVDENCFSYYGDPAFASARDYWGYILG